MGIILAIANRRGRVGKTTTAINLAAAYADSGRKVLLVDLDPEGSCAKGLGLSKLDSARDIFNDLKYNISLRPAILKTGIRKLEYIHIRRLPYLDEQRVGKMLPNELILRNIIRPESTNYHYIIIDCPPHVIGTINAALIAADSVLIPVAPGKFSLASVKKMISQFDEIQQEFNPELKIAGILLTMYVFNDEKSFNLKKELFKAYPKFIFNTSIPKSVFASRAFAHNKTLLAFKPDDRATKAYLKLAEELSERKNLFSFKRKN